jgi:hypothetical protein
MLYEIILIIMIILMCRFILMTYCMLKIYRIGVEFINSMLKRNSKANQLAVTDFSVYFKKRNVLKDLFDFRLWTFNHYIDKNYKTTLINIIEKRSSESPDDVIISSSRESV